MLLFGAWYAPTPHVLETVSTQHKTWKVQDPASKGQPRSALVGVVPQNDSEAVQHTAGGSSNHVPTPECQSSHVPRVGRDCARQAYLLGLLIKQSPAKFDSYPQFHSPSPPVARRSLSLARTGSLSSSCSIFSVRRMRLCSRRWRLEARAQARFSWLWRIVRGHGVGRVVAGGFGGWV